MVCTLCRIVVNGVDVSFVVVSEAYDPLDPNENITIKWDVMSWTPDGYVVSLSVIKLECLCRLLFQQLMLVL